MSSNIENERAIAIASDATKDLFLDMVRAANAAATDALNIHGAHEDYSDCIGYAAVAAAKAIARNETKTVAAARGAYVAALYALETAQDLELNALIAYAEAVAEATVDPEEKDRITAIAKGAGDLRLFVNIKMASGSEHSAVAEAAACVTNATSTLTASTTILADATAAYHAAEAEFA